MPHLAPHSPTQPYVALHSPTQPYVALQSQTQSYIIIWANLCKWTSSYNSTLPSSLHDKHAPLKKTVISRQRSPWFNSDIKGAVRERRKAERKWRNTNSQQDFRALKVAHNHTTYLMNSARRNYFSSLIAENSSNQRKLFRTTNSLLCELSDVSFPDHIPPARTCRVPKFQEIDTRPSFFHYWKGSREIMSFRSCTYICGSTGS